MTKQEINEKILGMYNDNTYQGLKAYYDKTTIFNVLGVERSETKHSAFLCWLLNANASHGLGDEPMKKLLRLYATKMDTDDSFRIMLMTGNYELELTDIVTEKSTSDELEGKSGKGKKKDRMDVWATFSLKESAGNDQSLALVIENKIYSGEGTEQTERYHQYVTSVCDERMRPIEIFLTPVGAKAPSCKEFVHINYQELLDSVILPLTHYDMSVEASQIIADYIRNLSKPSTATDGKIYSILATSATERAKLMEFYRKFRPLFHLALVAGNLKIQGKKECKQLIDETDNQELLAELWHSNEDLFKVVISVLKDKPEEMLFSPAVYESVFKETNRDTTKYNVFINGKVIGWHLSQAQTALHVFRAYLKNNLGTSLDDLRAAFPRELNNYSYFQNLQYLFYPAAADNPAWDCGKLLGLKGTGDFYTKEKDLLMTTDGKIMCVKWWNKTDGSFQQLIEHVKNKYPYIQIEEY